MVTTADDLLSDVLDACGWPSADGSAFLSHAQILRQADKIILGEMWPLVLKSHGDYYTATQDYPIIGSVQKYRLPFNLYGPVRDVLWVDGSDAMRTLSVPMIDLENLGRTWQLPPSNCGFFQYIDGDFIGLQPMPQSTDGNTLRIRYFRNPNRLVKLVGAGIISLLSRLPTNNDLDISYTASGSPVTTGDTFDIIGQGNAHQTLYAGAACTGETAGRLTVTGATATLLQAAYLQLGDYLAPSGYTPVVQLPDFMLPALVEKTAAACLRSHGESENATAKDADAARLTGNVPGVAIPRNVSEPRILVSRNSQMRSGIRGWR